MFRDYGYLIIGTILMVLYLVQEWFGLRWNYLYDLQSDEIFKRWSGLALSIFILLQWLLTIVRIVKRWQGRSFEFTEIHKWMGALSPLFFYFHAMEFGFAYLFILSVGYYINVVLGLLNPDVVKLKTNWYLQSWMISHVSISLLISIIMFYHIWIAFYYK